jgi:hypothetical protein
MTATNTLQLLRLERVLLLCVERRISWASMHHVETSARLLNRSQHHVVGPDVASVFSAANIPAWQL